MKLAAVEMIWAIDENSFLETCGDFIEDIRILKMQITYELVKKMAL